MKYTQSGGKIRIEAKGRTNLELKVSDTGYGIPKNEQEKIFTKLYRGSKASDLAPRGTGLGLYMVKNLLTHVGGKIQVFSHVGKGTTFLVQIPLHRSNAAY